jgi:5-methylcytosine-specific restriction endonuclease McrA
VLFQIAERDRWQCHVCKQGYLPSDPWEVDHDRPLAKGGTNLVSNLRIAHRSCNRDKAAA